MYVTIIWQAADGRLAPTSDVRMLKPTDCFEEFVNTAMRPGLSKHGANAMNLKFRIYEVLSSSVSHV